MIVVTGATGQLGRQVVRGLLEKLPAAQIGISVQNPEQAKDLEQLGIRVCPGDFANPKSLEAAFDGAEQVMLISVNKVGVEAVQLHRNAIQAAKQAGAKRILYTSHQAANPTSAFAPGQDHAATESLLQASNVPYVSLRNGFYAESALFQLAAFQQTGRIALPEDGPVSWTARADLAEAAVVALINPGLFDGATPALTAAQALNFAAVASTLAEILGRAVTRETIPDQEYKKIQIAHGLPELMAEMLGGLFRASRAGEFDIVDPTLARVLRRSPTPMKQVLENFLSKASSAH